MLVLPEEGLMGPLRPLKFCPTLVLHYTINFRLIDVQYNKRSRQLCVSAFCRKKQIQLIF